MDLGDLIEQEAEATSAAAQVGDPAVLLGIAQDAGEQARADVALVFHKIKSITATDPVNDGQMPGVALSNNGRPPTRA